MRYLRTFYHGTSTNLEINKFILPSTQTGILREDWRQKNLDKVYFTDSVLSAKRYAKKACKKYGGDPIVYIIKPLGQWFHRIDTEYIADKALVLGTVDVAAKDKIKHKYFDDNYLCFILSFFIRVLGQSINISYKKEGIVS